MGIDIFISYRRSDAASEAGRIFDRLADRFGDEHVFIDVENIAGGSRFEGDIEDALSSCRVLIVVIGPTWVTTTDLTGRRRIDDPCDIVRQEVSVGLDRGILVIPILLNGTPTPMRNELPEALVALVSHNAMQISNARFRNDYLNLEQLVAKRLRETSGVPVPDDLELFIRKSYTLKSPCSSAELDEATRIAGRFFPGENIDPGLIRELHAKSPNSFSALVRDVDKKVIAYADAFAVKQEKMNGFLAGEVSENDFAPDDFFGSPTFQVGSFRSSFPAMR